ncbi:hypothetical protein FRC12_018595 [Ceratobasidium sp. 428]|nr:hypothetical protein FRC12_018595 [Ceratobasidium sp. 428]
MVRFSLSFVDRKDDTIEWARREVVEADKGLTEERRKLAEDINNVGVDMNENTLLRTRRSSCSINKLITVYNRPYRMAEKYTEVAPADVIWSNLEVELYEARIRRVINYTATAPSSIFWIIPERFPLRIVIILTFG